MRAGKRKPEMKNGAFKTSNSGNGSNFGIHYLFLLTRTADCDTHVSRRVMSIKCTSGAPYRQIENNQNRIKSVAAFSCFNYSANAVNDRNQQQVAGNSNTTEITKPYSNFWQIRLRSIV